MLVAGVFPKLAKALISKVFDEEKNDPEFGRISIGGYESILNKYSCSGQILLKDIFKSTFSGQHDKSIPASAPGLCTFNG